MSALPMLQNVGNYLPLPTFRNAIFTHLTIPEPDFRMRCGSDLNLGWLGFLKITDRVHFLVRDADDIDGGAVNQIEHHVLAFREAVVTLADIYPVLPQQWIFGEP